MNLQRFLVHLHKYSIQVLTYLIGIRIPDNHNCAAIFLIGIAMNLFFEIHYFFCAEMLTVVISIISINNIFFMIVLFKIISSFTYSLFTQFIRIPQK